jgi:hypothetical protein
MFKTKTRKTAGFFKSILIAEIILPNADNAP